MKLVALVLAHHSDGVLERLIHALSARGIDSIVHLDARCRLEDFPRTVESGASLLEDRIRVGWGAFSMVRATKALVQAALDRPEVTHLALLSGDSYPIKSAAYLHDVVDGTTNYLKIMEVLPGGEYRPRIDETFVPDSQIGGLRYQARSDLTRFVDEALHRNLDEIAAVYRMKQTTRFPWRYAKGSSWWLLPRATVERLLAFTRGNDAFDLWFKYSSLPEESYFQTTYLEVFGSVATNGPLMHVDWSRYPSPFVFEELFEFEHIRNSAFLFARKFSDRSHRLLDRIDAACL